jgi:mono/diheme cytochrome c family protein
MRSLFLFAALALVGCGAAPHTRAAGAVSPLAVRAVAWNPSGAPVGHVSAVADTGSVVAVLGDAGATILSSGAVVATDRAVTDWADARVIRGADGAPRWIVGIDGKGHLYYLRGLSSFEDVSPRFGLEGRAVRGAAMLDPTRVGFLLDGEVAVAHAGRVQRFAIPSLSSLSGAAGFGAGVAPDAVLVFDATMTAHAFPLPGVTRVVLGPDGRLYATTRRALYASTEHGDLQLVYDADGDLLHGLAVSGEHVWFADGSELGVVDGDHVAETTGAKVPADARLAPSPGGDVWVLAGSGLARFARAEAEPSLASAWSSQLAPIFARACSRCHMADGVSGTDLSTAEGWQSERAEIADRVVKNHTMPPEGHPLSDADRAVIGAWVEGKR